MSWHPLSWFTEHYPDKAKYIGSEEGEHNGVGRADSWRQLSGDEERAMLSLATRPLALAAVLLDICLELQHLLAAISALQEAGGKITREHSLMLNQGFKQIVTQILWLVCQFYDNRKEQMITGRDGKSREVERKLYPGYVLVKMVMTDETWYLVRNTRGCTGFLGQDKSGGSKPIPLTEEEIIAMGVEKREIEVNYAAGDSVRVIDGPLAGFIGVVSSVEPDKNKVDVTVSMFGRETPVELELDQVETLDE